MPGAVVPFDLPPLHAPASFPSRTLDTCLNTLCVLLLFELSHTEICNFLSNCDPERDWNPGNLR